MSLLSKFSMVEENFLGQCLRADGEFCDRRGLETYYAVAVWARWHPSAVRTAHFFYGVSGVCSSGKLLRLKYSEMQSSAF